MREIEAQEFIDGLLFKIANLIKDNIFLELQNKKLEEEINKKEVEKD